MSFKILSAVMALILASITPLAAQTVRGQLVEEGSGKAIDAALVVLVDEGGTQLAGALTDPAGRFTLQAPAAGRYRLRAERIGYRAALSPPVVLSSGQTLDYRLQTPEEAISLEGVEVTSRRRCFLRPQDGLQVATLWEEARKALNAAAWTEREQLIHYRAVRYERELDPVSSEVRNEQARSLWGRAENPFKSIPAETLVRNGYVHSDTSGVTYYAPDAQVLLSDVFLDSYCFRIHRGAEGLVGIGFEPAQRRRNPDVEGVLWLDQQTAELRHLEFRYTGLSGILPARSQGGRVEFQRLPTGAWIVQRWSIRMPLFARQTGQTHVGVVVRDRLAGIREEGGEVLEVLGTTGSHLAQASRAALEGVVFDSIAEAPLAGARVFLDGTSYSATTDEAGRFRIDDLPNGTYFAAFMHPRLDSLDLAPPRAQVQLVRDSAARVELAIPSRVGLLAAGCSPEQRAPGTGVVVGFVHNSGTDLPLAGSEVVLSWPGGQTVVRTNTEGAYRFCMAPLGVALSVQPQVPRGYNRQGSQVGDQVSLTLESEGIAHQDLSVRFVQTVARSPQQESGTTVGRAEVRGRLLDAESGQPVQGAVVRLQGQEGGRTTDRQGRFVLPSLRPDQYTLEVEHLAYGTQAQTLAIGGGGIVEVELRLSQHAIELPGLTVEVLAARETMRRRSGTRLDLFTREDIEDLSRTIHHVGDLARRIPGLRVRELLHWGGTRDSVCIESSRTMPDPNNPDPASICQSVKVYLDDMVIPDGPQFLVSISLTQLESVQFIPGIVAQARYGHGAENGVLLIYTRGNGPTASNRR